MSTDEDILAETGISRKQHENRNDLNELPTGKLKPTVDDAFLYEDEGGRLWRRNPDFNAAYHQPMPLWLAAVRAIISNILCGLFKVPNLKFISKNADGTFSEVCCNRYTGKIVLDPQIFGTYNFCKDTPNAMDDGKLPNATEHKQMDVIPHEKYGGNYKHVAKGIPVGYYDNRPVPSILYVEDSYKDD